ncbi:MAG: hypothetical protein P4L53_05500 [Candidatus Obscuribacterales bacterium]|nr:hypothetical protein [Candidatus Obscuribacterales bacterium]
MKRTNLMKARQIKAVRALLGWLEEDLAHATRLFVATTVTKMHAVNGGDHYECHRYAQERLFFDER